MRRLAKWCVVTPLCLMAWSQGAVGADRGTMHLAPDQQWAEAIPEKKLGNVRGGFRGLAFSAFMTAFVENQNGNLSGSTGGTTPGPSTVNTDVQNGQVSISAAVGFTGNLSGVFNVVQVPGSYNVVNSTLSVQVAVINVVKGAQVPTLSSIFGPR